MVRHVRVWSTRQGSNRASTVQMVPGGKVAVQCLTSKQELHCEKDCTSYNANGLTVRRLLVIPHPICNGSQTFQTQILHR